MTITIITIIAIGIIGGTVINKMIDRSVATNKEASFWVMLAVVVAFTFVPAVALVAIIA